VGQVAVHLHEGLEPAFETPGEAVPIGAPEARLARTPQHVDSPDLLADRREDCLGLHSLRDQRCYVPQRGLLVSETGESLARLGVGSTRNQSSEI